MKQLYHERTPSVKNCVNGLFVDTGCYYKMPKKKTVKRSKRGEITEFSRHSRKRLQMALLTLSPPPGWFRFGLCVTVPGEEDNWQDNWLKTVKRFWEHLTRQEWQFSAIYRVELQQRGMPHMHLVVFTNAPCLSAGAMATFLAWQKALEGWIVDGKSLADNWRWGITAKAQEITYANSFRYLFDHSSKKKQVQLGYKGKQWGIFGRKWLTDDWERVPLSPIQREALYRYLRLWSKSFYKGENKGRLTRIYDHTCSYSVPLTEEQKQRILNFVLHPRRLRRTEVAPGDARGPGLSGTVRTGCDPIRIAGEGAVANEPRHS